MKYNYIEVDKELFEEICKHINCYSAGSHLGERTEIYTTLNELVGYAPWPCADSQRYYILEQFYKKIPK